MAGLGGGYQLPYSAYEPHPSGGTMFTPAGGGNPILVGPSPEADRIKGLIDRAPAPQLLAQNGTPPPDMTEPARHGVTVPPSASDATAMGLASPPQAPPPPQGPAATAAEASMPLPGAPPAPGAAPPKPPIQIDPYKHVAGVSAGALASRAAQSVAVPTTQSITAEGAIRDPKVAEDLKRLQGEEFAAQGEQAVMQKDVAIDQAARAKADAIQAQADKVSAIDEMARTSAARDVVMQEGKKRLMIAQQDLDKENKREVDQYAIFRGNPGAQLMSTIGVALGQFGAVMTGTRNVALDQLNRQIDNSVQAQRDSIARGVAGKSNDLARIMDEYKLDRDDATHVLKLAYQKKIDAAAQQRAALLGTDQAKLAYAAIQPRLLKEQADQEAALQTSLEGKISTKLDAKMVQPSAGGNVKKTLKEITEEKELNARGAKAENAYEHGGIPVKEGVAKPDGEITPNLSRAAVATENALSTLHELHKMSRTTAPFARVGQKIARFGGDTDYAALVNHASNAIASMESNGMAPDPKRVDELEHKLGSMNPAQQEAHIASLIDIAEKKKAALRDVSSKTARVGNVGAAPEMGGEE